MKYSRIVGKHFDRRLVLDIQNKIFAGDCREVLNSFPENSVSVCITDPPYNYEFVGHKWNAPEITRRITRIQNSSTLVKNIPYGSGLAGGVRNTRWYQRVRENIVDYQEWCYQWSTGLFRVMKPGGTVAVFNSTRTMAHVQVALERAGFYARDCLVYRRASGIPKGLNLQSEMERRGYDNSEQWAGWHSCLRNEWEAIVIVQKPLINNYLDTFLAYQTGLFYTNNRDGSFQSNILEGFQRDKPANYNVHCTVKPLQLMEKLIEMFVPPTPDQLVLDPFAGSGTTLVAAKKLGRKYVGIEIVDEYIAIINQRLDGWNGDISATKITGAGDPLYTLPLFEPDTP
jgi:site-specific DNA-methyltransferase (adenine-specific)